MKVFVLVHGAYHGAWCWNKVAPLMREKGIPVFTPTLSGLGEKAGLLSPSINLSTHISDIVSFLESKNLQEVILVGHSYSGFVISGVAQVVPGRIAHLVYLDAMVPANGERVLDIRPSLRLKAEEISFSGKKVKVLLPPLPQALGIDDPQEALLVKPLLTPMPFACYDEPVEIKEQKVSAIKKTYLLNKIQTPGESQKSHEDAFKMAQGDNWARLEICGAHDSMLTHPRELAEVLLQLGCPEVF